MYSEQTFKRRMVAYIDHVLRHEQYCFLHLRSKINDRLGEERSISCRISEIGQAGPASSRFFAWRRIGISSLSSWAIFSSGETADDDGDCETNKNQSPQITKNDNPATFFLVKKN